MNGFRGVRSELQGILNIQMYLHMYNLLDMVSAQPPFKHTHITTTHPTTLANTIIPWNPQPYPLPLDKFLDLLMLAFTYMIAVNFFFPIICFYSVNLKTPFHCLLPTQMFGSWIFYLLI